MTEDTEKNKSISYEIWNAFDKIIDFLAFLSGVLVVLLIFIIAYEVIMRYFIHKPVGWIVEVCEYILLYITFLGTTWLLREGGHISVDIILNSLSSGATKSIHRVNSFVGAIACFFIVYYGTSYTWELFKLKAMVIQTLNTPKWILFAVIPFGSLLIAIQFLRQAFSSQ